MLMQVPQNREITAVTQVLITSLNVCVGFETEQLAC